jgi:divalent metal cation (Fe/Co/Zn/Cd) transporter
VAAGLVGAWLGFHSIQGLAALLTSIAAAAVGGNLILLALDIAWDRRVHHADTVHPRSPSPSSRHSSNP